MKQRRDGLLPRMQAITRKKGIYYRYITRDNKHIGLGYDLNIAIRTVLEMNGKATDVGKINKLWEIYSSSPDFLKLATNTQNEYKQCAKPLLKIFGDVYASHIKAPWIYRYLTVERASAPVRANREKSLLSNLIDLAIRRGEAEFNPCKQVRRNEEQPRTESPSKSDFEGFMTWLKSQGGRRLAIAQMAEFCAYSGSRKIEFLNLTWHQVDFDGGVIRVPRAKQRGAKKGNVIDVITMSPNLMELLKTIRASNTNLNYVFPAQKGMPYTASGFKGMWGKLKREAKAAKIEFNATFHDLRAYYATTHKAETGVLPDLHANPQTTARVYDRSKEFKRKAV